MNTNHLKKFAQEARRKLLEQVGAKLNFVLTTDSAELREKTEQLKQLRQELTRINKEQLIEKVAYTWFNRMMALRFMDVNDYQPLGIRIITPKDRYTIPELLDEVKRGNIPDELKVNRQRISDLLDNRIPSKNPQNEVFKELLIAACNHLHTTLPFLFEEINDYTELLLPDDLTSDFSIVKDVRDGMPLDDSQKVEIIGWLYQFYISEKKDEVFASKSKVKKEDIPAATQIFTPRWIVEYMVQNTLGKIWLQNRPKSRLREHMPYFIESATLEVEDYLKINSPEEIKFLDPASGSGHILVYAFDLLTKIYEEEGYNTSEIPQLIIEKNLFGFEIDERAAQLSSLALMIKAREYQRRVFRGELKPNVFCFQDLQVSKDEINEILGIQKIQISDELMHDMLLMQQATNFGSLIMPHANSSETENVLDKLTNFLPFTDVFQRSNVEGLIVSLEQLHILSQKFHCLVANPPYMGSGNMNAKLSEFVKNNYPDSKADLMACFMESGLVMLQQNGFLGIINQHSWMFLSSYETLRKKLINNILIDTLLHLGPRTFPEIGGEVVQNASFTLRNKLGNVSGKYIRLVDYDKSELKRSKTLEAIRNPNCGWFYTANQKDFEKIPASPIGYWISPKMIDTFSFPKLRDKFPPKLGLSTTKNEQFLRFYHEVSLNKIGLNISGIDETTNCGYKWFPITKGGEYRKWYGNNDFIVNYENNGKEVKHAILNNPNDNTTTHWSRKIFNTEFYFKQCLSWSRISSSKVSFRFTPKGSMLGDAGPAIYINKEEELLFVLSFVNSNVAQNLLKVINPTLTFQTGNVANLPISVSRINKFNSEIVSNAIEISKTEWNFKELSLEFSLSPIFHNKSQDLKETYDLYKQYWKNKFFQLHQNEEELNRQFIEIYGLQDELTPDVPLEDISILKEETSINNGQLVFHADEVFSQFISYSVGCMFGRYSLDKECLILANQGETLQNYLNKIGKSIKECSFLPDEDNIIPILDDEWFEDDVIGRFIKFLKVTFGDKNFNINLAFIEEQIGKDIRKYFTKDFYPDHIKRYKKRPIYWMFSSPKGSFNVLIYMHRYTPDTVSNILNKYLKEFIGKLNTRKEHLEHVQVTGSASDKAKAIKEIDNIEKMLIELHEYERDVLYPLATERIEIDLDDGVLVNYNKFGKAVKEVNGLNDPATKKKVKQFDWIDTSQIR